MSDEVPGSPAGMTPEERIAKRGCAIVAVLILAGGLIIIVYPAFRGAAKNAKINDESTKARGIVLALYNYATDHNGEFPTAENNSNVAFRKLIPDYLDNEEPFYIAGSAWHESNGGKPPEDIGKPPDYAQALERGENHWAYVSGLRSDSPAHLPIIADGFTEVLGAYTDDPTKKGGLRRGQRAIVCYVDGSVRTETPDPKSFQVIRLKDGQPVKVFSEKWGTESNNALNPEG